jgi:hypothetical protein
VGVHDAEHAVAEGDALARPQDSTYLRNVANCCGQDESELRADLCSDDPIRRAAAYREIGNYHGFANFNGYPLTLTRTEAEARYAQFA